MGGGDFRRPGGVPTLAAVGITKDFGALRANDKVSVSVQAGEIHALLGENGAGKSTLVKMIYGIMQPDAGDDRWQGKPVTITSPRAARRLGIGMVFQHFSLFEALTVFENIALGSTANSGGASSKRGSGRSWTSTAWRSIRDRIVSTLSVGERQRIEIVRALLLEPKLLIMDEPTSVLTPQEVDQLFVVLRQLAREGCSILYISHKLHEIKALCDTATILRGGKVVAVCDPRQETARSLAEKMIGGNLRDIVRAEGRSFGKTRLAVKALSAPKPDHFGTALQDISFEARAGEILGIAGVAGNGQNELLLALDGEVLSENDAIAIDDQPIGRLDPGARRRLGLCAVPEERNGHAAVGDFSLTDNAVLTARDRQGFVSGGMISAGAARAYANEVIAGYSVKATGQGALAGSLSGGNLQKYIMGREIMQKPAVLVVNQPTWGVDAGAAASIHQALVDLAASGSAIVVISQDLDELLALCDTLAVINMGRLSPPVPVEGIDRNDIGLLMGGIHGATTEAHPEREARDAVPA
jgi:ABC-type uncharacterized transport system ATPase subunit